MKKIPYLILTAVLFNSCKKCQCLDKCGPYGEEIAFYLKLSETGQQAIDEIHFFKDSINILLLKDSLSDPLQWYKNPIIKTDNSIFPVSSKIELTLSREIKQQFDQYFIIAYSYTEQDTVKVSASYQDEKCAIEYGLVKDYKKYVYYGKTSGIYLANQ